jgi:membrane protease YdiL (CAAX protease family)
VIDSGDRSKYANAETARNVLYLGAALAATVAILFLLATSPLGSVVFAAFAAVLFIAGRESNEESITGRWNWLDILAILALIGVVWVYGSLITVLGKSPLANSVETTLIYAGWGAAILFVVMVRRGARLSSLGWRLPAPRWYLAVPVAVIAGNLLSNFVLTLEFHTAAFHGAPQTQCTDTQTAYGTNLVGFLVALPVVSLAAPVVEETFFRGVFYSWLAGLTGNRVAGRNLLVFAAMLASALVFGAFHAQYGPIYILPLTAVGLVLTSLYQWSGSIVPGVLAHSLFNAWGAFEILLSKASC